MYAFRGPEFLKVASDRGDNSGQETGKVVSLTYGKQGVAATPIFAARDFTDDMVGGHFFPTMACLVCLVWFLGTGNRLQQSILP